MDEMCTHKYDVTFSFTVTGFGNTEEEAVEEARDYAVGNWIANNSKQAYTVDKVAKSCYVYSCDKCTEEQYEKLGEK